MAGIFTHRRSIHAEFAAKRNRRCTAKPPNRRNFQIRDFLSFWRNWDISAPMHPVNVELFYSILRSKQITPKQPNVLWIGPLLCKDVAETK